MYHNLDLYQLAAKANCRVKKIHSCFNKIDNEVRLHCYLNEKLITCINARKFLESKLIQDENFHYKNKI